MLSFFLTPSVPSFESITGSLSPFIQLKSEEEDNYCDFEETIFEKILFELYSNDKKITEKEKIRYDQILGYTYDKIQGEELCFEVSLIENNITCTQIDDGLEDELLIKLINQGRNNYTNLLQFDSDPDIDMNWIDVGVSCYFIRNKEFNRRDYSKPIIIVEYY